MLLALEVLATGERVSAFADEVLSLRNRTDFSAGVPTREFLDWSAAMEEMPIIFLELGDPMPVMVLCDPCGFGNVWFR